MDMFWSRKKNKLIDLIYLLVVGVGEYFNSTSLSKAVQHIRVQVILASIPCLRVRHARPS